MNTILLKEYLTRERLANAGREIEQYENHRGSGSEEMCLVIDSMGCNAVAAMEFAERIGSGRTRFGAKIYRADSAAALIALAAARREIVAQGILTLNLGSAEIPSNMLLTPEKVPAHIIEEAKRFREKVFALLTKAGFPDSGPLMEKLLVQNELTLGATDCLELGIVERVI